MIPLVAFLMLMAVTVVWLGWRFSSRRALLPCPAEFSRLVELENPLARATRSAEVIRGLKVRPNETIIDIGCGPGRVTLPLAEALLPSGEVIAIDVQAGMLAIVQAKAETKKLGNIRLRKMDPASDRLDVRDADAAIMVMMLGEVPDPHRLLKAVREALKDDGRLLIAESVFDPHYVRRASLRALTSALGLVECSFSGNFFGYQALYCKRGALARAAGHF